MKDSTAAIAVRDASTLPVPLRNALAGWATSPKRCYGSLPVLRVDRILKLEDSPTLLQIKTHIDEEQALMAVTLAIDELSDFVNIGTKMTPIQKAMAAKLVLGRFWYFRMEDIKGCFYDRLTKERVFTLDGQTILRWLGEYDLERDRACEDEAVAEKSKAEAKGGVSYDEWLSALESAASKGDTGAKDTLDTHRKLMEDLRKSPTEEQLRKKEMDFRIFKHNYLKTRVRDKNI